VTRVMCGRGRVQSSLRANGNWRRCVMLVALAVRCFLLQIVQ